MLDDQGIDVDVVRSADALDAAAVDASTTIVVTFGRQPGPFHDPPSARAPGRCPARRGRARTAPPARSSGSGPSRSPPRRTGAVPAGCPAYDALALRVDSAQAYRTSGCFRARRRRHPRRPAPRPDPARRVGDPHQRPGARGRQRRRRPTTARAAAAARLVRPLPGRPRRGRRRLRAQPAARAGSPRHSGCWAWPASAWSCGAADGSARWRTSHCRSRSRPSRPRETWVGSTAARATVPTPPRRCAPRRGPDWPTACGSPGRSTPTDWSTTWRHVPAVRPRRSTH